MIGSGDLKKEEAGMIFKEFQSEWFDEPVYDEQGFIPYHYKGKTYNLWFGKIGKNNKPPLLVIHGGPGNNHFNLVALQALGFERPIIFYDQLGCGNSERPYDSSLWLPERFFNEVQTVKDFLGLEEYHLLGHSWGTTVATAFAHKHPQGISSLSLHSPILSFPKYLEEVSPKLKKSLPGNLAEIIDACELEKKDCGENYENAVFEYVKRYVILTIPFPEPLKRMIMKRNKELHRVMIHSDSELNILGNLKDIDVSSSLSKINIPVLFTCGQSDLCTPEFTLWHYSLTDKADMHIIENSAHMSPVDNPLKLLNIQMEFMQKHEKNK